MILQVNGSTGAQSSNGALLEAIRAEFPHLVFQKSINLGLLPLFAATNDRPPYNPSVLEWKSQVLRAHALLICTPAYLENIPAALKNAFEWLKSSGELDAKAVLAMTYTPHPPRGERALRSMLWSLQALNARVVAQLPLFANELSINNSGRLRGTESITMLKEGLQLLTGHDLG